MKINARRKKEYNNNGKSEVILKGKGRVCMGGKNIPGILCCDYHLKGELPEKQGVTKKILNNAL